MFQHHLFIAKCNWGLQIWPKRRSKRKCKQLIVSIKQSCVYSLILQNTLCVNVFSMNTPDPNLFTFIFHSIKKKIFKHCCKIPMHLPCLILKILATEVITFSTRIELEASMCDIVDPHWWPQFYFFFSLKFSFHFVLQKSYVHPL